MIKNEDVPFNDWITKPFTSELYYMDFPYINTEKVTINDNKGNNKKICVRNA